MEPLTASEFWSLDKEARRVRINHGFDTDTCSACCKPLLEGQARNGMYSSHYDCTDLVPPPTKEEVERLGRKIDKLIAQTKTRR